MLPMHKRDAGLATVPRRGGENLHCIVVRCCAEKKKKKFALIRQQKAEEDTAVS